MKPNIIFFKNINITNLLAIVITLVIIVIVALFFSILIILLLPLIILCFFIFKLFLKYMIKKNITKAHDTNNLETNKEYIDAKYKHVGEKSD